MIMGSILLQDVYMYIYVYICIYMYNIYIFIYIDLCILKCVGPIYTYVI